MLSTINNLKHSLAKISLFSLSNVLTVLQWPLSMTGTTESMHDFNVYYPCPTERKGTMKMGKNKEGSGRRTMKRRGNKERKGKEQGIGGRGR